MSIQSQRTQHDANDMDIYNNHRIDIITIYNFAFLKARQAQHVNCTVKVYYNKQNIS